MGIFRRLFKPFTKELNSSFGLGRALFKHDRIAKGEKVLAPKYKTEEIHFKKAQEDPKIREEVDKKRDDVIENVNKLTIKSFDPPEKPKSKRPLPTRQDEQDYLLSPKNEYGFHEPPLDKMLPGKITLREAMDLLYAKTEVDIGGKEAEHTKNVLATHPANARISAEDIDSLYEYYRPFIRKDVQRVVNKYDLTILSDFMNNRNFFSAAIEKAMLGDPMKYFKKIGETVENRYAETDTKDKDQILDKILNRQLEEHKRLESKMKEFAEEADSISKKKQ